MFVKIGGHRINLDQVTHYNEQGNELIFYFSVKEDSALSSLSIYVESEKARKKVMRFLDGFAQANEIDISE